MYILLQNTPTDGSILGATADVIFFILLATALATTWWYFYQKKDKKEIEDLKKALYKIQPQHDVLQNQHEHLKAEHLKVKQGLADLMDNYQELNTKHTAYVSNQTSTKNLYEQVDEERQSLLDSYESMESNYNALDSKYNDAITTLDRLEAEVENLSEDKEELMDRNTQLKNKITKLEGLLGEKGTEIISIKTEEKEAYTDEDDEIEKLIGASQARQMAASPARQMIDVEGPNIQKNHELQATYEALKEDYNQLRNEHTQLNNHYHTLKETHNQLAQSEGEVLHQEIATEEIQTELIDLNEKHQQLQTDYAALKIELNETVLPKLRATQSLLNQKEENYRQLVNKLEAQTSKIQSSSSQLKNFDDVKATNQALYISNKNLAEKNTDLEKQYEKLNTKHKDLSAQFQLLREQFTLAESKLETLDEEDTNSQDYEQLVKDYEALKTAFEAQEAKQAPTLQRLSQLESLLSNINDSSSYGITYSPTSLDIVEGVPPKVSTLLHKSGIKNWTDLAQTDVEQLKTILNRAGKRYEIYDPTNWSKQAALLANGQWKAFKDLEAELITLRKKKDKQIEFDDLKIIEGIGPKIEVLLNNANIYTWKKLSKTGIGELKRILKAAGSIYEAHEPNTWPEQASLAASWNWTELEALQAELKSGRQQV